MQLQASYNKETGELSVTYRGETRVFKTCNPRGDYVIAYNVFATKFKTGTRLWPSAVTYWIGSEKAVIEQGGFSNKGGARGLVGWWNAESAYNTQSRGKR